MKKRTIAQLVLSILVLATSVFGFLFLFGATPLTTKVISSCMDIFKSFEWTTLFFAGLTALIVLILDIFRLAGKKADCGFIYWLKSNVAVISLGVFIVFLAYWLPKNGGEAFKGPTLYSTLTACLVGPVLSFIAFGLLDGIKRRGMGYAFASISLLVIYFAANEILVLTKVWVAPCYSFINFNGNPIWLPIVALVGFVVGGLLAGFSFWCINNKLASNSGVDQCACEEEFKPDIENFEVKDDVTNEPEEKAEEYVALQAEENVLVAPAVEEVKSEDEILPEPVEVKEEKPVKKVAKKPAAKKPAEKKETSKKTAKPAAKVEKKVESKKSTAKKPAAKKVEEPVEKEGPKVYHVSRHPELRKWQVKSAKSQKAVKLFDTQKEALDYANELAKNQGGSVRLHSTKGKMRKA